MSTCTPRSLLTRGAIVGDAADQGFQLPSMPSKPGIWFQLLIVRVTVPPRYVALAVPLTVAEKPVGL